MKNFQPQSRQEFQHFLKEQLKLFQVAESRLNWLSFWLDLPGIGSKGRVWFHGEGAESLHILMMIGPSLNVYYRAQNDYTHIFIIWEFISPHYTGHLLHRAFWQDFICLIRVPP